MSESWIKIPALKVEQPIGTFYIGVIESSDIVKISYADVRRPEGRDIEKYIGTQRDLSQGRVSEIKQYVNLIDACFPTSVIVAIDAENATYDEKTRTLKILDDEKVAKIIDGQHRLAGLEGYSGKSFQLNITAFIDMDIEDQAMVFATINLKQAKVTKSLAYDLYEYASSRSPQKTCHNIAKLMNFKKDSPFKDRIKILGKATGLEQEVITQSTFVDRLLKLISTNPMDDRDRIKRNKKLEPATGNAEMRQVFRERFINEKDAEIAKIIWNYFKAVEERWPRAWNNFESGQVLSRTTGFAALVRFLPEALNALSSKNSIPGVEEFGKLFKRSKIAETEFTSDVFKPGSSGEGALYGRLESEILSK